MTTDWAVKEPTGAGEEQKVQKIELTADDLEAKLQSETDKRVTQATKKLKADFEKDKQKAIEEAKKEAEEMAQMNAEERFKLEQEKAKKALAEERASFQREKLLLEAEKSLVRESLPVSFASLLVGADAEKTEENIAAFKEDFFGKVHETVEERLRGKSPKTTGDTPQTRYTKEQVDKMSPKEVTANLPAIEESMKSW